jgi:ribonuclease HI
MSGGGEQRSAPVARTVVFTDGAAKGNPGPGGWGAIVLTPGGEVTELGGAGGHTTNNRMELSGAIAALESLRSTPGPVDVHTDSTYLIHGISRWIKSWKRRSWKTVDGKDVLNRDLWEELDALVEERGQHNAVRWHYVKGHTEIPGNVRADRIATEHAAGRLLPLYRGPVADYPVPLLDLPALQRRAAPRAGTARKRQPYSYLSVVAGRPMRHRTWAECESRVKGRSGARFKKAMSRAEEAAILHAWGFCDKDLRGDRR